MTQIQIQTDDLPQLAFTAYVDAAQWTVDPHQRLEAGSRAAAEIVTSRVKERIKAERQKRAAHGTISGFQSGCRCKFCRDARRLYDRAYKSNDGKNAVHS